MRDRNGTAARRRRTLAALAGGLVLWIAAWAMVLDRSVQAFRAADAEFWRVYVKGPWSPAMRASHIKQVNAYEWGNLALTLGFVLPLILLISGGICFFVYRGMKRRPMK